MTQQLPKRLIEVDLPIKRISAHARREKSIRHGHISTLHIWWARRPLAACRAVTCAALWPDPVDENCPAEFRAIAAELMFKWGRDNAARGSEESAPTWTTIRQHTSAYALCNHPTTLRQALLDFIADFANWDNSTVTEYLATARALTAASHWALSLPVTAEFRALGWPGQKQWFEMVRGWMQQAEQNPRPIVVDPFAGGGSIPMEALRVGADSFASDLNPIPILLNKVILEYIPKYGNRLADEVRKWGDWVNTQAGNELSKVYPKDKDGAIPSAYLWARTIKCEGPSCGAEVPILPSRLLEKNGDKSTWMEFQGRGQTVHITIKTGSLSGLDTKGTAKRGSVTCPCCGFTTPVTSVREQLKKVCGGVQTARLLAVSVSNSRTGERRYRLASDGDYEALDFASKAISEIRISRPSMIPDETLPLMSGVFNVPIYGHNTWASLYSDRQLLLLVTLCRLVAEVGKKIASEKDIGLAAATATMLSIAIGKVADYSTSICTWVQSGGFVGHTFAQGQCLPMKFDYAESVPLSGFSGSWMGAIDWGCRIIERERNSFKECGHVERCSATGQALPDDAASCLITDPPYYNAVPYADLSDFFYVWHKRTLNFLHSDLFKFKEAPKAEEICEMAGWDPVRYGNKTAEFFETEIGKAFADSRRVVNPRGVAVIVFAHKTTSGWESLLQAIVNSGWVVTGSWPIDTERASRLRAMQSAALASSIHLVCRPREDETGVIQTESVGDWRDILGELPKRIHDWMPRLAAEGVVGADAIFACLGPALEIYSRYSRVEKASGEQVTLREYLEHVWAAVSKEALSSLITGSDLSSLESDARITAMWLWTLNSGNSGSDEGDDAETAESTDDEDSGNASGKGGFGLEYDAARKIAQGLGASLDDMKSVVEVKGDKARLLPVAERTAYLFGKDQASAPDAPAKGKKKKAAQLDLFAELTGGDATEAEAVWEEKTVSKPGATVLDRLHQSMILFATGRGEALKRFLVEDGIGREGNFWKLAQALSALYPSGSQEKRWVDGVLARKKGLGL
jgi:putative DNA methylase